MTLGRMDSDVAEVGEVRRFGDETLGDALALFLQRDAGMAAIDGGREPASGGVDADLHTFNHGRWFGGQAGFLFFFAASAPNRLRKALSDWLRSSSRSQTNSAFCSWLDVLAFGRKV